MKVLQEWECYVSDMTDQDVILHMKDLTDENNPDELATIEISKLGISLDKLKLGTILFWKIVQKSKTEAESVFELYDQVFTEEDIRIANKKAEELIKFFNGVRDESECHNP